MTVINTNSPTTTTTAADTPQPTVKLDPETIVEQIRSIRSQIDEVTQLTAAQKKTLRNRARTQSEAILASSINVIGALDTVAQAVGRKPEDVRQLQTDWSRWTAVADELRGLLNGIEGANLVRRQELSFVVNQAFSIGARMAKSPENSVLVPHIQEIKRLKSSSTRKKKTAGNPQQSPAPHPAPVPNAPATTHEASTTMP
jgi:hypothetical protein